MAKSVQVGPVGGQLRLYCQNRRAGWPCTWPLSLNRFENGVRFQLDRREDKISDDFDEISPCFDEISPCFDEIFRLATEICAVLPH